MPEFLNLSKNTKIYLAIFLLASTTIYTLQSIANPNKLKRIKHILKLKSHIQS